MAIPDKDAKLLEAYIEGTHDSDKWWCAELKRRGLELKNSQCTREGAASCIEDILNELHEVRFRLGAVRLITQQAPDSVKEASVEIITLADLEEEAGEDEDEDEEDDDDLDKGEGWKAGVK